MQDDPSASISSFFQRLCHGSPDAAEQLWQRFSPRLLGLARKTLLGRKLPGVDPQDVAQSAFICFWRQASEGRFAESLDRDELWRLLGVITKRKAQKKMRHALAKKRGGGKELSEAGCLPMSRISRSDLKTSGPSCRLPKFDVICTEFLEQLD